VLLIWLALVCAYLVKETFRVGIPTEALTAKDVLLTFGIVAFIWLVVSSLFETYAYKRRLSAEIANLTVALIFTIAFFLAFAYVSRIFVYPRWLLFFFAVFGTVLLAMSRGIKETWRRALHRRGKLIRRVIIIGNGTTGMHLADFFRRHPEAGYGFVGFVTDAPPEPGTEAHLGTIDRLESILDASEAEEVIVALAGHQHERIAEIADRCQAHSVRLRIVPDLFDVIMVRATFGEIDGIPLIGVRDPVITGVQSWVKRIFDLVVAGTMLLVTLPIFLLIAMVILVDSRGRIFYAQERAGENGRVFRMLKFRTMFPDADEQLRRLVDLDTLPEPAYKLRDDPRVTRFGKLLRRTSLDELPQLLNVLRGDMSMVGPRPEDTRVVAYYNRWHRKRLAVKPGLTGPMQVAGRGELPLDERIRLELMYISQYSLVEDIKYLLKTVPAVVRGTGAY